MPIHARSSLPILLGVALTTAFAGPASADPYRSMVGPGQISLLRDVSGGWLDAPLDAELDPIYGRPASTSTFHASGIAAGLPEAALALGLPWGEGRWSLALSAARRSTGGLRSVLDSEESDLDGDSRPDLLRWRVEESLLPNAGADARLALRTGIRAESFAMGLGFSMQTRTQSPAGAVFAFPATRYTTPATVAADDLYDLESGERLAGRRATLDAADDASALALALDLGLIRRSWRAALGFGWQRERLDEIADVAFDDRIPGGDRRIRAERNLETVDDWIRVDLRIDSAPKARGWRWTIGPGVRALLGRDRAGSEVLLEAQDGLGGTASEEWVRQRLSLAASGLAFDASAGLGWVQTGGRGDWALGFGGRIGWLSRSESWEDRLVWRIDDPGLPGQTGASFLSATGGGFWTDEASRLEGELTLSGGARIPLAGSIDLLAGSRLGWAYAASRFSRSLDRTTPIRGERLTDPGVVDPVELAYGNFETTVLDEAEADAIVADLRLGLAARADRFQIGALLGWRGLSLERLGLEAGVTW